MKLKCDKPLSIVAFNFIMRRYIEGCEKCGTTVDVNCPPENTGLCCHKKSKVGRCRLTVSKPELNARLVSECPIQYSL